jgi:hypothetical protein
MVPFILMKWFQYYSCRRTRSVKVNPACGGTPCAGSTWENRDNTACVYGDWGAWTSCNKDTGLRSRCQQLQASSLCGSCEQRKTEYDKCPVNCEWGAWSEWSSCKQAGSNWILERSRVKAVVEKNGGSCSGSATESKPATPTDCTWGTWGEWTVSPNGSCQQDRTKTREASCGGSCDGNEQQFQDAICYYGNWGQWASCSKETGTRARSQLLTRDKVCGTPCSASNTENQTCPVDCEWGEWSEWGLCEESESDWISVRVRSKTVGEKNGGTCSGSDTESKPAVSTDCSWSVWSEWFLSQDEMCSRNRNKTVSETCGGDCVGIAQESAAIQLCEWGQWTAWTACANDQWSRSRNKITEERCATCSGSGIETQSCDGKKKLPEQICFSHSVI